MKRIGIAIKRISEKAPPAKIINVGDWAKKVVELRDVIKQLKHNDITHENIIIMLSFDENGSFITLFKTIGGRGGNNVSVWIYVPNKIDIDIEDLMKVVETAKQILSTPNIDLGKIEIFKKEYTEKKNPLTIESSAKEGYAIRYTSYPYSLKELLGNKRYQKYYSAYRGVFLIDKESGVTPSKDVSIKDLTEEDLVEYCILINPDKNDILNSLGKDVKIYFASNNKEFISPIQAVEDETILFVARRNGFKSIRFEAKVKKQNQKIEFSDVGPDIWEKIISESMFELCDNEDRNKILTPKHITVNNKRITSKGIILKESECENVNIIAEVDGYDQVNKKGVNLLSSTKTKLYLTKKQILFKAELELANNSDGEISIKTRSELNMYESPIKGYNLKNRRLTYDKKKDNLNIIKGFVTGVALCLVIWGGVKTYNWIDNHKFRFYWKDKTPKIEIRKKNMSIDTAVSYSPPPNKDPKHAPEAIPNDNEAKHSTSPVNEGTTNGASTNYDDQDSHKIKEAVDYLQTNNKWDKNKMEKNPILKGLFESINKVEKNKIVSNWAEILKDSERFRILAEEVSKTDDNKIKGVQRCSVDDYIITYSDYIVWIKGMQSQKKSNPDYSRSTDNKNKGGSSQEDF